MQACAPIASFNDYPRVANLVPSVLLPTSPLVLGYSE